MQLHEGRLQAAVAAMMPASSVCSAGPEVMSPVISSHFERIERRLERLEHESTALMGCLEDAGLLGQERFKARLHRQRFSIAMRSHPCDMEATLPDVLMTRELRLTIGSYVGWEHIRKCASLGRSVKELTTLVARVIYMCGGFDGTSILDSVERFDPNIGERYTTTPSSGRLSPHIPSSYTSIPSHGCLTERDYPRQSLGSWEPLAPMVHRRAGFAAAACDGALYVCGGFDGQAFLRSTERYRPQLNGGYWEPSAPMAQPRHCAAAGAVGGALYICGGFNGEEALRSMERLDPVLGVWQQAMPMSVRRHGASSAVLGGRLYMCGGFDGDGVLNSAERYDGSTGVWEALPPLRSMRNMASSAAVAGRIYVCGGCSASETLRSTEFYDPEKGIWEAGEPMSSARHGAAAAVAGSGHLFVLGGGESVESASQSGGRLLDDVEAFRPRLQYWSAAAPMRGIRIDMCAISMFEPA